MLRRAEAEVKCVLFAAHYAILVDFFTEATLVPRLLTQAENVQKQLEDEERVIAKIKSNPNIRLAVSCTCVVGKELFSLPMNNP